MEIKITINTCEDCRYSNHSGAFTKGGAKPICDHPFIFEYRGKGKKDPEHWRHRILPHKKIIKNLFKKETETYKLTEIPDWCPLLHGEHY